MYTVRSHVRSNVTKVRLNKSEYLLLAKLAKEYQMQPAVFARYVILGRLATMVSEDEKS
jgi:hypothetical protein